MNSSTSIKNIFEFEGASTKPSSELMEKKSTLRALTLKRDKYAQEISQRLGLPLPGQKFWTMEQVNFDDPKLADIKDDFNETVSKISEYSCEVGRLEAIHDGELPRHEAKIKAYSFLNKLGDEATAFLKSYRLTTVTLTEAVLLCPTLLDNLMDFEENLEIIRADPTVWW